MNNDSYLPIESTTMKLFQPKLPAGKLFEIRKVLLFYWTEPAYIILNYVFWTGTSCFIRNYAADPITNNINLLEPFNLHIWMELPTPNRLTSCACNFLILSHEHLAFKRTMFIISCDSSCLSWALPFCFALAAR